MNRKEKIFFPIVFSFVPCFLIFPVYAFNGAKNAILLCMETLIPSLFAFMVVSEMLTALSENMNCFSPISKLLKVPPCCGCAVLLSFLGGYPVGIKCLSKLYADGKIEKGDAKRLSLTLINPSPAFIITAVGKRMLGSIRAGIILTVSVYISNFILSAAMLIFKDVYGFSRNEKKSCKDCRFGTFSSLLVESVTSSSSALIYICMFTVFFGSVAGVFSAFLKNGTIITAINCLLEVTIGVDALKNLGVSLPFFAAALSFGGMCVIMQIIYFGKDLSPAPLHIIFVRLVSAVISFITAKILSVFYMPDTPVISNITAPLKIESRYGFFSSVLIIAALTVFLMTLEKRQNCKRRFF